VERQTDAPVCRLLGGQAAAQTRRQAIAVRRRLCLRAVAGGRLQHLLELAPFSDLVIRCIPRPKGMAVGIQPEHCLQHVDIAVLGALNDPGIEELAEAVATVSQDTRHAIAEALFFDLGGDAGGRLVVERYSLPIAAVSLI